MTPRRNLILALFLAGLAYAAIHAGLPRISWNDLPRGPWHFGVDDPRPELVELGALAGVARAQRMHESRLFALTGVRGTGLAWTSAGAPALKIFVDPDHAAALPREIGGFPVIVQPAGPFYALGEPVQQAAVGDAAAGERDARLPTARFDRPVPLGVSTGHLDSTAGTIGAVVTDGLRTFALSNWHVYVPGGRASVGDVLLQPGPYDGGVAPADVIGTLAAFEPVTLSPFANNRIDAALARTDQVMPRTPEDGYGSPRAKTLRATPGLSVKKYGRTTGMTFGQVDAINASINVSYGSAGSQVGRFTGQIVLCCDMSQGGDSGSLVVAHDVDEDGHAGPDDRRPVALLFAGDRRLTIANPIDLVLDRFGVTIVEAEEEDR